MRQLVRHLPGLLVIALLGLGLSLGGAIALSYEFAFSGTFERVLFTVAVGSAFASVGALLALLLSGTISLVAETARPTLSLLALSIVAVVVSASAAGWQFQRDASAEAPVAPDRRSDALPASSLRLPEGTNVMLLLVDTLRPDHLSYAGYRRTTSPALDRLAKNGVVFSQAVAQATRTSPNMASLLTGLSAFRHGIVVSRSSLEAEFDTWPELLAADGYQTTAILTNPNTATHFGFTQGVQEVFQLFDSGANVAADQPMYKATQWLKLKRDNPFFLWLHLVDPHAPYTPPPPYDTAFTTDRLYRSSPTWRLEEELRHGAVTQAARLDGLESLADYVAQYDGTIRYIDEWVGRLVQQIEPLGLLDDTLIVFTSDHGESLGEHNYYFAHGSHPYDTTARVPLFLHHPALPSGLQIDSMVRTIDILPTVLDLVGAPVPPGLEGRSLVPLLEGHDAEAPPPASIVSGSSAHTSIAIRTAEWKLALRPRRRLLLDRVADVLVAHWGDGRAAWRHRSYKRQLFHLARDPGELHNRAGMGEAVEAELLAELARLADGGIQGAADRHEVEDLDPTTVENLRRMGYLE